MQGHSGVVVVSVCCVFLRRGTTSEDPHTLQNQIQPLFFHMLKSFQGEKNALPENYTLTLLFRSPGKSFKMEIRAHYCTFNYPPNEWHVLMEMANPPTCVRFLVHAYPDMLQNNSLIRDVTCWGCVKGDTGPRICECISGHSCPADGNSDHGALR